MSSQNFLNMFQLKRVQTCRTNLSAILLLLSSENRFVHQLKHSESLTAKTPSISFSTSCNGWSWPLTISSFDYPLSPSRTYACLKSCLFLAQEREAFTTSGTVLACRKAASPIFPMRDLYGHLLSALFKPACSSSLCFRSPFKNTHLKYRKGPIIS